MHRLPPAAHLEQHLWEVEEEVGVMTQVTARRASKKKTKIKPAQMQVTLTLGHDIRVISARL